MDFAPQTLSIFVTVLVIIGVMGMALLVDLLKGNVEQLREVAIDLKARKDAAEQHIRILEQQVARTTAPQALAEPNSAAAPLLAQAPSVSSAVAAEPASKAERSARRKMSPAVAAVAESVAARMAAGGFKPAPDPDIAPPAPVSLPPLRANAANSAKASSARKNWSEILKSQKREPERAEEIGVNNLIPFETFRMLDSLPGGYHDYSVLQRVAASGQRFTGLAISIGMNDLDRMQVGLVTGYLRSLLEVRDFGCLTGSHEFLMVCNQVQGEAAQRRLSAVAEKLWDFQLRSIGSVQVQFSWGAKEGHDQSLNDVVAAAIDQMQETRRSRPASAAVRFAAAGMPPAVAASSVAAPVEYQQAV